MKSKVSSKGQTVIPAEVRKALGIEPGTTLLWEVEGNSVLVVPMSADPVRALMGSLKGTFSFQEFLDERNRDRERERALEQRDERQDAKTGVRAATRK